MFAVGSYHMGLLFSSLALMTMVDFLNVGYVV
jgi:hypothetical protein